MKVEERGKEKTRASLDLLYHVSREFAAALDIRAVLHRVLYLSMQNIGAISGSILVLDDNGQPVETAFMLNGQSPVQNTVQLRLTFERGLAGWVARHRQAVRIGDTSLDPRWLRRPDDSSAQTGPKSAVCIPILVHDRLVGVMTLVHPSTYFFQEDHLHLVQAIADQAGIAILNARLYAESQRQGRVMAAIAESAAVINASLDLEEVLHRILVQASQALRVEFAFLVLAEPGTELLVYRAFTGPREPELLGYQLNPGQGIAGWVVHEQQGLVVPETRRDPRVDPKVEQLLGERIVAIACSPIFSEGEVIGALEVINPVEKTFDADALLVLNGIGNLAGTAILHAQYFERLQAVHQRYRELFEDSIDPILHTDTHGGILEANRPALSAAGMPLEVLRAKSLEELGIVDPERVGPDFSRITSGATITYETTLHSSGGKEIPIQVNCRRVQINKVDYLQWILRDITEKKKLDQLREDLSSMIYHDLRSPLANVVSILDVLASVEDRDDNITRNLLNIAIRSTERIQRLVDSLLDINRLEVGEPLANRRDILPKALISEAVEAVQPLAELKAQHIEVSASQELPPVFVDADMIRRVLVNLLENAVKFTPQGEKLSIRAEQVGDAIKFSVIDKGPGIPVEDREAIFNKFTRLTPDEGPKGLGLGLAFCRLAVSSHGGQIWVESGPEQGSIFTFTLPLKDMQA